MALKEDASKNIKNRRLQLGLTQQGLADRCRKTIRYINFLENSAQNITMDTLESIATALECKAVDLLQPVKGAKRKPIAIPDHGPDSSALPIEIKGVDYAINLLKEARRTLAKEKS